MAWVMGHVGLEGNEAADELAKRGAMQEGPGRYWPAMELTTVKQCFKKVLMEEWMQRWQEKEPCRQTKHWFTKPRPNTSNKIKPSSIGESSLIVQFITGFSNLNMHSNSKDSTIPRNCRL